MSQSSYISTQKNSLKKSPFYKHQNIDKLNYYARFSPNRKKLNKQFEQDILAGASPLSPRSRTSSTSSKKLQKSFKNKIFKDQSVSKNLFNPTQEQNKTFQLIDETQLLEMNSINTNHGEIYIDQSQDNQCQITEYPQILNPFDKVGKVKINLFKNDDNFQDKQNIENKNLKTQTNQQESPFVIKGTQQNSSSQNQQSSSSFQRMVEPSSSDDVEDIYLNKGSNGGQILICDEEDEDQQEYEQSEKKKVNKKIEIRSENEYDHNFSKKNQKGFKNSHDPAQNKIFQLANKISANKRQEEYSKSQKQSQKNSGIHLKQVHSQNVSFSLDSDLSIIEQRWNSYFDDEGSGDLFKNSQKVSQKQKQRSPKTERQNYEFKKQYAYQRARKMSASSSSSQSSQLPSFSTPTTSKIGNTESLRSSKFQQQQNESNFPITYGETQNNIQSKQFKRQFTFGNQLSAKLITNESDRNYQNPINQISDNENKQKNVPLFMKLVSKQALQNFKQKKVVKNKLKNTQKQSSSTNIEKSENNLIFFQKSKFKNDPNFSNNPSQDIKNLIKYNDYLKQSKKSKQQFTFRAPITFQPQNTYKKSLQNSNKLDKFKKILSNKQKQSSSLKMDDFPSKKKFQKAKKNQNWQNTLKNIIQKSKKQKSKEKRLQEQKLSKQKSSSRKSSASKESKKQQDILIEQPEAQQNQQNDLIKLKIQQGLYQYQQKSKQVQAIQPQLFPISHNIRYQSPPSSQTKNHQNPKIYNSIYLHKKDDDQQSSSYSKIYSQKRQPKNRKGSYQYLYEYERIKYLQKYANCSQSQENYILNDYENSSQYQNEHYQSYKDHNFYIPKGEKYPDRQSLTTATQNLQHQQTNYQSQEYSTYKYSDNLPYPLANKSAKRKQNYNKQIQNLKKYLEKINQNHNQGSKNQRQEEDQWIGSLKENDEGKNKRKQQLVEKQNGQRKKQHGKENQLKKSRENSNQQKYQSPSNKNHQTSQPKDSNLFKSLKILQQTISTLPSQYHQYMPIYQKLYTQIYEQELKYQKKLQRQQQLIQFMNLLIQGNKQKLNCQDYLSTECLDEGQQEQNGHKGQEKQNGQRVGQKGESIASKNQFKQANEEQKLQIFINKHIILSLIRKIAEH